MRPSTPILILACKHTRYLVHILQVLWILILILISIILPDPDWERHPGHADRDPADTDWYQVQANEKVDKLNSFLKKINIMSKILKIMAHLTVTLMRKIKHCELAML